VIPQAVACHSLLGISRYIVSPRRAETIIQVDWRKQADLGRKVRLELLDDLPWGTACFVGVGPGQVEVELIEGGFGEELSAGAEGFQVVELVFDEAMDGFDAALIGVGGGRDALVLGAEVSDGAREMRARALASMPCWWA
jgi:hypothetical protein